MNDHGYVQLSIEISIQFSINSLQKAYPNHAAKCTRTSFLSVICSYVVLLNASPLPHFPTLTCFLFFSLIPSPSYSSLQPSSYEYLLDRVPTVPKITQNSYCTLLWRARGARAYNGGPGAEPLVRESGGRSPPEAENLLKYWSSNKMENEPIFTFFSVLKTAYYQ